MWVLMMVIRLVAMVRSLLQGTVSKCRVLFRECHECCRLEHQECQELDALT